MAKPAPAACSDLLPSVKICIELESIVLSSKTVVFVAG